MKRIRILIADDHALVRAGIRVLLEKQPNMEVVAEASNGREAIEFVRQSEYIRRATGPRGTTGNLTSRQREICN